MDFAKSNLNTVPESKLKALKHFGTVRDRPLGCY